MNMAFLINSLETEHPNYTTPLLALQALRRGHGVSFIEVGNFVTDSEGGLACRAVMAGGRSPDTSAELLASLKEQEARRLPLTDLDVLFLRNNPADDFFDRPWAAVSGILFGQLASKQNTLVVNDPGRLANAVNKTYFEQFPVEARPRTMITRDMAEIAEFAESYGQTVVLKPLQGSGGQGVFMLRLGDQANRNQMIEAIRRDGYVVVQEYIPEAEEGDQRVFLLNGEILTVEGKPAVLRRVNRSGDFRSNMHAGAEAERGELTDAIRRLVNLVRPKLLADGMFFVGLDVVGDKLMEVNVFSPGGLYSTNKLWGVDFTTPVIEALERKMFFRDAYGSTIPNRALAVY